jgi:hypothetical protein
MVFYQIGIPKNSSNGIGFFKLVVVLQEIFQYVWPMLYQDMEMQPFWSYFCQISDSN